MKVLGYALLFATLAGAGYGIYKYRNTFRSKEKAVQYLNTIGKGTVQALAAFDEGYLLAFANAAISGKKTFEFNSKTYTTQTGKAIVSQ